MLRRYPFANVTNLRDLGGYPAGDGQMTQHGRILRSDAPLQVSDKEFALLQSIGLSTVIDLRSPDEAKQAPCTLATRPNIQYHNCPVYGADQFPAREEDIPRTYMAMASKREPMGRVFRLCATAAGAVLVHCSAGKDRTGVVSALLLLHAGVSQPDILADYQVSFNYLQNLLAQLRKTHPDMPVHTGFSKPEYMARFLELFHTRYGDVEAYLSHLGLTPQQLANLRSKLLDR